MDERKFTVSVKDEQGNWVHVPGLSGRPGNGIESIEFTEERHLVITETDGNVTDLDAIDTALTSIEAEDASIRAAEALRVTAEGQRESAESVRENNEDIRYAHEETRQSQEITRQSNEVDRANAENLRVLAEESRERNEAIRDAAETVRDSQENSRIANESERISAETEREEYFDEMKDDVVRSDDEEPTDPLLINADQLNGHKDYYFATQVSVDSLENRKVDKIPGMGLSTNDYSNVEKNNVKWNTEDRHWHNNKSLLDTYTQSEDELADAVYKKHVHSNKSILDLITQAMIDLIGTISEKYVKPVGGIPKDEFTESVQESLSKADTALQEHQSLAGYITYDEEEE